MWDCADFAGSSTIEPGTVPAEDITLYWPTWDDYAEQCRWSRLVGGALELPPFSLILVQDRAACSEGGYMMALHATCICRAG